MNTLEVLKKRKSIRQYHSEMISDEQLQTILEAAYIAPIGHGLYDSVHLSVISNADYLNRLEKAMQDDVQDPNCHPFYGAPLFIIVSSIMDENSDNNVHFSNAAIIVHNMAIAATELNIGTCHIWGAIRSLNKHPELLDELNLPEGMKPCCGIIFGYSDTKYEMRSNRKTITTSYLK